MRKLFFLTLVALTIFGCSADDKEPTAKKCSNKVIVSEEEYKNAPSDNVSINSVKVEDDCLKINFSAGGCDGNTWEVKLIDESVVMYSSPIQRNVRLSLKNREICDAYITKELSFDISALKVPNSNKVSLNIKDFKGGSILYKY